MPASQRFQGLMDASGEFFIVGYYSHLEAKRYTKPCNIAANSGTAGAQFVDGKAGSGPPHSSSSSTAVDGGKRSADRWRRPCARAGGCGVLPR
ncbi:hypothetical protein HPP92_003999 [Vanilla planifolia]|uniref:Uncharacterized protein n=1 Tax=Vanilla planifolia TaxID=51239 RepID=A0A835S8L6_VANPL|nr:hypothetical protein HPP92_003999 [Vanilla planifolia]